MFAGLKSNLFMEPPRDASASEGRYYCGVARAKYYMEMNMLSCSIFRISSYWYNIYIYSLNCVLPTPRQETILLNNFQQWRTMCIFPDRLLASECRSKQEFWKFQPFWQFCAVTVWTLSHRFDAGRVLCLLRALWSREGHQANTLQSRFPWGQTTALRSKLYNSENDIRVIDSSECMYLRNVIW